MTPTSSGGETPSRLTQALLGGGGLLVLLSLALPWYAYANQGAATGLSGVDLFGVLPVLGLLVACGVGLVLLGAVLARPRAVARRDVEAMTVRAVYTLAALGSFVIPLVAAYLYNGDTKALSLVSFWDGAGMGWGLALVGGTVALLGAMNGWILGGRDPARPTVTASA